MSTDDPYAPQPEPTEIEVLLACETLLRAGYTAEAHAVMHALLPQSWRDEVLKVMTRGQRERAALQREDRDG